MSHDYTSTMPPFLGLDEIKFEVTFFGSCANSTSLSRSVYVNVSMATEVFGVVSIPMVGKADDVVI